jgi:glycosyltransferase involved in cell wall biosynthesis
MHDGGGEREIHLLNEAINHSGMISDIYGPSSRSINAYQSAIHFSMAGGSEYVVSAAAENGLKLILWPNLWFVQPPSVADVSHLNNLLKYFHAIVFRSDAEETHFRKYLDVSSKDIIRIFPLISPKFFRKNISDVFRDSYGLKDYAIWTGIIEPQKNQLAAIRAFNELDVDLIISGGVRDQRYFEECKKQAGENIKFIPAIPFASEQHLSAITYSKLVIELPYDFPGTSAIEAAVVGAKLLLTKSDWTEEILNDSCSQVDVWNHGEIIMSVEDILSGKSKSNVNKKTEFMNMYDAIAPLINYLQSS